MHNYPMITHKSRKLIVCILVLSVLVLAPGSIATAAGSGGLVTLTVTVSGLADASDIAVTAEKEIDGVPTFFTGTTDSDGVAILKIPFGGTVHVTGEPVSGFLTPSVDVTLRQLKGNLSVSCELAYEDAQDDILVTGVSVKPEIKSLFIGQTVQLEKTIEPPNATNQDVNWSSDHPEVAFVDGNGLVTAVAGGTATITATTVEGGLSDSSVISVLVIESVNALAEMAAAPGSILALPQTVTANLSGGGTYPAIVSWELPALAENATITRVEGIQYLSLEADATGSYALTGDVEFTTVTATLNIEVLMTPVIPIETASLNTDTLALFIGLDRDTAILTLNVVPEAADTSSLIWRSSNELAVQIDSISPDKRTATIRGVAPGEATISVLLPASPEETLDTCLISVAPDPLLTDPAYIVATLADDPAPVDQFDDREDVYIRCYDLPDGNYHIRVTDKGNRAPLGTGEVEVTGTDSDQDGVMEFLYNLFFETGFALTNNYSVSYFIEMSTDASFPAGDDEETGLPKTFVDNFKITSPVPTLPKEDVNVLVQEIINGVAALPSASIVGKHVILCREIDLGTAAEYKDYIVQYGPEGHPVFSDEVKLIGHVGENGWVDWDIPKETIKIGGYILLIELPGGYVSNLNLPNPETDDGSLLKEVHITRKTPVYRTINVSNQGTP
ncbi:MAG: Ig-like domain-containing protein [Clostridia bacterium]|nr:Ig-like domain-containing protein [Clostridia bacterium]